MSYRNEVDHQVGAHLKKVDNATLANPRNQQKWTFQDLAYKSILLDAPLGVVSSFEVLNMSTKVEMKRRKFPM